MLPHHRLRRKMKARKLPKLPTLSQRRSSWENHGEWLFCVEPLLDDIFLLCCLRKIEFWKRGFAHLTWSVYPISISNHIVSAWCLIISPPKPSISRHYHKSASVNYKPIPFCIKKPQSQLISFKIFQVFDWIWWYLLRTFAFRTMYAVEIVTWVRGSR